MNETYTVRAATFSDLPTIMYHRRRMFEDMKSGDSATLDVVIAASELFFREKMENRRYFGWFVESGDDKVVAGGGVLFLDFQPQARNPRPTRAYVVNMFTEHDHRGRGLARKLMEVMIAWCKEQQLNVLFLHASEFGRPLYESLGFVPTNEMRLDL